MIPTAYTLPPIIKNDPNDAAMTTQAHPRSRSGKSGLSCTSVLCSEELVLTISVLNK